MEAYRKVFIISYNAGGLFEDHWGLWIPSAANPDIGTIIHVKGDSLKGFELEFKRNYNRTITSAIYIPYEIADVDPKYIVDTKGDGKPFADTIAHDKIEQQALLIPAPPKSLKPAGSGEKAEIKNCQTWMYELVNALIADEIFPPSALTKLNTVPKKSPRKPPPSQ